MLNTNIYRPRNELLNLCTQVGELCEIFQWKGDVEVELSETDRQKLHDQLGYTLSSLNRLAVSCDVILSEKEATFKDVAKLTDEQQQELPACGFSDLNFEDLRKRISDWCNERDWNQFHSPRNLAIAMVGEVGELCEIFRWHSDITEGVPQFDVQTRTHIGEELADILHHLVRLSDRCRIDLVDAIVKKMVKNSKKYPAEQVKGSSKKYNEYKQESA